MSEHVTDTDKGFAAMLKRLTSAAGSLTVGIHESEGSAAAEKSPELTVVQVASFHEFGTKHIPRRSFIADWSDEFEEQHKEQLRKMARAVLNGTVASVDQGLNRLGNLYVGEIQRRISQGIAPPLKKATVDRKGSSKPLIDTGQLRSSIVYKVVK